MEQEPAHIRTVSPLSSSSSSSSDSIEGSSSPLQVHEETGGSALVHPADEEEEELQHRHSLQHRHNNNNSHRWPPRISRRLNISISNGESTQMREDAWSCLIVLVTFWFFVSMTVILGFYGSESLTLGPNCSELIRVNPLFVQTIKAHESESKRGPMLYGFYEIPPLDTEVTWSETRNVLIQSNFPKEWMYFLNKGSKVDISYIVKSPSFALLSLVIAKGRESLVDWTEDPSYPNTTLSWNIIHGNGIIQQEIQSSETYYIAVANFNSEVVEVQLNFTIKSFVHDTTGAYYKCSLNHHLCRLKLFLLRSNAALLSSPATEEGVPHQQWRVKLSYGPRWITYFLGSGTMTVMTLLAFRICGMFQIMGREEAAGGFRAGESVSDERAPLLLRKDDDDLSSWGSSYGSLSHDDEEEAEEAGDECLGKTPKEGEESNNRDPRQLCVRCFNAPRDCFFLPCGHCAACFTCGTRIVEEAGICPICQRTTKKVRKIFTA